MNTSWKHAALASVLQPITRSEKTSPSKEYKLLGVRLENKGPFLRETKLGSQSSAPSLSQVRAGDFIYSRLFAWRGAFGLIPNELDGCYVSGEFPTFIADTQRLDPTFLRYWFTLPDVLKQVEAECTGSTPLTRNRFKEDKFLALAIPLPPLSEQKRIVAWIEELAGKIEETKRLRGEAEEVIGVSIQSCAKYFLRSRPDWTKKSITAASKMSTGTTPPSHVSEFFGGGVPWYTPGDLEYSMALGRSSRTISMEAVHQKKARMFEPGTVLLVAIGGSLGKVALVQEACSANQQITGIKFGSEIAPEYGFWWMRSIGNDLRAAAPQATLPIINQRRIGEFPISYPTLPEQRRIVAYLDDLQSKVDSLKKLQAESSAELDALLPSILDKAFKGEL